MPKIWIEFDDITSPTIYGHYGSFGCGYYYWLGSYQGVGGIEKEKVGVRGI